MMSSLNSGLNRTLKESEINLEITHDSKLLGIQFQSNPAYPGQIFFVDNPQTLEIFREQLQNESIDSFDDTDSNCSDDIGPAEHERLDDAMMGFTLDKHEKALMQKINDIQKLYIFGDQHNKLDIGSQLSP